MCASASILKVEEWLLAAWPKAIDLLAWILWNVALGLFLIGCEAFLFQVALWLRRGTWIPITFTDFLPSSFPLWIAQHNDWFGIWKAMTFVLSCSAWWVLIVLAVPVYFAAAALLTPPPDSSSQV